MVATEGHKTQTSNCSVTFAGKEFDLSFDPKDSARWMGLFRLMAKSVNFQNLQGMRPIPHHLNPPIFLANLNEGKPVLKAQCFAPDTPDSLLQVLLTFPKTKHFWAFVPFPRLFWEQLERNTAGELVNLQRTGWFIDRKGQLWKIFCAWKPSTEIADAVIPFNLVEFSCVTAWGATAEESLRRRFANEDMTPLDYCQPVDALMTALDNTDEHVFDTLAELRKTSQPIRDVYRKLLDSAARKSFG